MGWVILLLDHNEEAVGVKCAWRQALKCTGGQLAGDRMEWSRRTACCSQHRIDEGADDRRYKVWGAGIDGCWIAMWDRQR